MPNPLPVLLLGRLAIDRRYHNRGIGSSLLRDAMLRAVNVASAAGVFAIMVHALTEPAKQFYRSRGFVESPLQPMTLMMTIENSAVDLVRARLRTTMRSVSHSFLESLLSRSNACNYPKLSRAALHPV